MVANLSRENKGFTLVEMAVVLVIVGTIMAFANTNFRNVTESERIDLSRQILRQTREALFNFARNNHRLPCPDVSGTDGIEDCGGGSVGSVPFQTMGLDAQIRDSKSSLLQYSVYRNSAANADLAVLVNRGDAVGEPAGLINRRDFCTALNNASTTSGTGFSSTSTEIITSGCSATTFVNQAFVLASAGLMDADGIGNLIDDENSSGASDCFASPEKPLSKSYDDLVNAVGLNDISGQLCH